jgi:hypothetical protein
VEPGPSNAFELAVHEVIGSAVKPIRQRPTVRCMIITASLLISVVVLLGMTDPLLLGILHGTWWVLYHLWNPALVSIGHGIWWLLYHLWNPVILVVGRWLFRILLDLVAVGSIAELIRTVVATLAASWLLRTVARRRERQRWLRQQSNLTSPETPDADGR